MSHQRYGGGSSRRGRAPHQQYRSSPRGPPREQHHSYRTPPQTGPPPQREGVYANPHLAHSLTSLVGNIVEVKLTSGIVFEGICSSISPKLDIVLEAVHDKDKPATSDNVKKFTRLNFSDIVNVTSREEANIKHGASDIFKTDTEISQSNGSSTTRALQPFDFDEGSSVEHLDSDTTGWSVDDMFQVNKEKFAVNSTYDADMVEYTTKLERQDTETFRQREERAQRIAREIESNNKSKLGIDDTGTEEEMFSAVVRQEVALPPTSSEATPLHPNGEVPSIMSESAPPTTAASLVANSSAKTDTSSAGTSDSQSEVMSSDARLAPEDMPPLSTTGDGGVRKDAESASSEKVEEPQGVEEEREEAKRDKGGKDESDSVSGEMEKTALVETPATSGGEGEGEGPPAKKEEEETPVVNEKKTENIRKFKLDPNAKVFTPGSFSLPSTPVSSPSPAPSSSSSTRSASSTPYLSGKKPSFRQGGRQGRTQHQHVPAVSTFFQPDVASFIPAQSMAQAGYVIQNPFVRPALHTPPTSGQVFYAQVPQYPGPGGIIAPQPGLIPPQQLVAAAAANPKFMTEIQAQPQVIAGQHFPQTSQAHQFISPPTQALLQPTVSQPQLVPTPQGLVSAHQPVFVQGNLATAAGAAGAGSLVGGAPFSQFHQQTLAVASANQPGVAGAQQVTPNRPLFQHQPLGK